MSRKSRTIRKVFVLSYSGNAGKSTWTSYIILPRLPAQLFEVETINDSENTGPKISARKYDQLIEAVGVVEDAVVDVGASNAEQLLYEMARYPDSHADIDVFVIPCTEPLKQQRDTITTIEALADLGVPPEKIRVGFNNIDRDTVIEETFHGLFEYQRLHQKFRIYPDAVVRTTDLFAKLRLAGLSITEVLSDDRDFKRMQAEAPTREEKLQWTIRLNLRRLAIGVDRQLEHVFNTMFSET
ncbi:StbB family protein [Noviherbaspirillum sp. Root189]|uniref:StbB family protein n=1 Tax=Noviherbaspirillum sp. Root189 TaxID=1736487 RepID=UPI00070B9460|nr:StbB family protein [Noviherbaspirillum sp. Root189]KRB74259.1 hypothetical protein ASE07_26805 [Noviherbaspirillum sp. Root189]